MPEPITYIQVTVGSTDYQFPLLPVDDGGNHVLQGVAKPFADPAPPTSQESNQSLLPHQTHEWRAPLSIGLRKGNDPHRCWWQKNVIPWWDKVTLGPLKSAATWTAGPATFKVPTGTGFLEAFNNLFMFGSGAASGDEPIFYLATTTWTDATLNADMTGDVRDIVGMAFGVGTVWALNRTSISDESGGAGNYTRLLYKSTSSPPTTWARANTDAAHEPIVTGYDRAKFLTYGLATGSTRPLGALAYVNASGRCVFMNRDTTDPSQWVAGGEVPSTAEPRGLLLWHDYTGADTLFASTNLGLYMYKSDATWAVVQPYVVKSGTYTGVMCIGPDDAVYFADGPNLWRFAWLDGNGKQETVCLGPGSRGDIPWDGIPLANQGHITAVWPGQDGRCVYAAIGGLAASKNAWIGRFDVDTRQWYVPYENSTEQRATMGGIESGEDDGTTRMHTAEESAAGGDQDPRWFPDLTSNPAINTAFTYAASDAGVITTSRFDGFVPYHLKSFLKVRALGDSFDATEYLSIKVATNGGALGDAQTITANRGSIWTDSGSVGTGAYDTNLEVTLKRDSTNTNSPKVESVAVEYKVIALKDDNTPIRTFAMRISLNPAHYSAGMDVESPADARARLETILASGTLVKLSFGQDFPVSNPAKVLMRDYTQARKVGNIQDQQDLAFDPAGSVMVTFTEVI